MNILYLDDCFSPILRVKTDILFRNGKSVYVYIKQIIARERKKEKEKREKKAWVIHEMKKKNGKGVHNKLL